MTEKRFTLEYEAIVDNETLADDGGRQLYWTVEYIQLEKLVELLNSLNDENEQLRHDASVLIQSNQDYRKENKQLKQTMQEVAELLSEEVDLFSEKANEHDINAYRELNELDNKDAYYMATATKKAIKMLKGDVE